MQLLVKNKAGNTVAFEVEEIISIDGRPYSGTKADLEPWMAQTDVRLAAHDQLLNSIVAGMFAPQEQGT